MKFFGTKLWRRTLFQNVGSSRGPALSVSATRRACIHNYKQPARSEEFMFVCLLG